MGNCKRKCPLKVSRFTDECTLGYCAGKVQNSYNYMQENNNDRNQEYERE